MDDKFFLPVVTRRYVLFNLRYHILDLSLFQGMCGAVTGHWSVNFNEAACVTWWDGYYDKVSLSIYMF